MPSIIYCNLCRGCKLLKAILETIDTSKNLHFIPHQSQKVADLLNCKKTRRLLNASYYVEEYSFAPTLFHLHKLVYTLVKGWADSTKTLLNS